MLFGAYCASCHGLDAKGTGPAAASLKTPPADLEGRFPLDRVQKTISGEEFIESSHGSREMPIWGPIFGQIVWDRDLRNVRLYNLAKYIETLQEQ